MNRVEDSASHRDKCHADNHAQNYRKLTDGCRTYTEVAYDDPALIKARVGVCEGVGPASDKDPARDDGDYDYPRQRAQIVHDDI
jgi:hypothetical protein